jgi:hypothetical protein
MVWTTIENGITDFLNQFIGRPPEGFSETWPLEEIIRAESIHFLFSVALGWLVFSLILTIYSSRKHRWSDRYIFQFGLLLGLFASVTIHILIDGFTNWA